MTPRLLSCLISGLVTCAAAGVAVSAPVRPVAPPATMTREEALTAVAILDDAYSIILHEVHETYHHSPKTPVAASVVRNLQRTMTAKGWPASRFLAVNAIAMRPDHLPRDEWERKAVAKLKSGRDQRLETQEPGVLRVATTMSLRGGCGSCHWSKDSMGARAAIAWKVRTRD